MPVPERGEAVPDDGVRFDGAWEFLQTRSLAHEALWLRSLYVIGVRLTLCVGGVTLSGHRRNLGLVACAPEDIARLGDFLQRLVKRGLCIDEGLLCILASGHGFARDRTGQFGSARIHTTLYEHEDSPSHQRCA